VLQGGRAARDKPALEYRNGIGSRKQNRALIEWFGLILRYRQPFTGKSPAEYSVKQR